jgi:hypothetical protein
LRPARGLPRTARNPTRRSPLQARAPKPPADATPEAIRDAVGTVDEEWPAKLGAEDLERLRALLARLGRVVPLRTPSCHRRTAAGRYRRGRSPTPTTSRELLLSCHARVSRHTLPTHAWNESRSSRRIAADARFVWGKHERELGAQDAWTSSAVIARPGASQLAIPRPERARASRRGGARLRQRATANGSTRSCSTPRLMDGGRWAAGLPTDDRPSFDASSRSVSRRP